MKEHIDFRGALRRVASRLALVVAGFIVGLAVALTINSFAQLRLEAGAGVSHQYPNHDGLWWQSCCEHHWRLDAPSWQIGARWNFAQRGNWALGVRGAWTDLGMVHKDAFATDEKSKRIPQSQLKCNLETSEQCLGRFRGQGALRGWTLGPTLEYDLGRMALGAEVGLARLWGHWQEELTNTGGLWGKDGAYQFNHSNATGWNWGYYFGANAAYRITSQLQLLVQGRLYPVAFAHGKCGEMCDHGLTQGAWQILLGVGYSI